MVYDRWLWCHHRSLTDQKLATSPAMANFQSLEIELENHFIWGWWDGSTCKDSCPQAWQAGFHPWDSHGRRGEPGPKRCPLVSTCMPHQHTHSCTRQINKCQTNQLISLFPFSCTLWGSEEPRVNDRIIVLSLRANWEGRNWSIVFSSCVFSWSRAETWGWGSCRSQGESWDLKGLAKEGSVGIIV